MIFRLWNDRENYYPLCCEDLMSDWNTNARKKFDDDDELASRQTKKSKETDVAKSDMMTVRTARTGRSSRHRKVDVPQLHDRAVKPTKGQFTVNLAMFQSRYDWIGLWTDSLQGKPLFFRSCYSLFQPNLTPPPSFALRAKAASVCLLPMTFVLGASRLGFFVFLDSQMHAVELKSHFSLGRLCERRRLCSSLKLVTPSVTCSQRTIVLTPEENASFSTSPKRFLTKTFQELRIPPRLVGFEWLFGKKIRSSCTNLNFRCM